MAKKDLRAQMDAARAAAAFIGAAQEAQNAEGESAGGAAGGDSGEGKVREGKSPAEDAPQPKRASRQVRNAASDVTMPAGVPDFFAYGTVGQASPSPDDVLLGASADTVEDVVLPRSQKSPSAGGERSEGPVRPSSAASASPVAGAASPTAAAKPKAPRSRKPRKKSAAPSELAAEEEASSARMTAQVLVPMTAEQREHADLLAQVMKVTRAEVMRQALDEYWENHKADLQAAVEAYEQLIRKLMK